MGRLKVELINEEARLQEVIYKTQAMMEKFPEGIVRVSKSQNSLQFYYKKNRNEKGQGRYMKSIEKEKALQILQRMYSEELIKKCKKRLRKIEQLLKHFEEDEPGNVILDFGKYGKELLTPILLPDSLYREVWQSKKYPSKPFAEGIAEIYSERGERVRSKSEKIIADKLYREGIPYRYEYPYEFDNGRIIYPDFTILDLTNRREIILEHLGLIDNEDYLQNFLLKLQSFEKAGLMVGHNLLLTYETSRHPFDSRRLHELLVAQGLLG